MKHIIKVASLENLPETRPLIAMDDNKKLFAEGQAAGPEMVDLGLSVKWAKYNIGVNPKQLTSKTDWYGKYLMWGELEEKTGWDGQGTKVPYDWANYTRHTNGTYSSDNTRVFIKYIPSNKYKRYWKGTGYGDNLTALESVDDVVTQEYGSNYRMPTNAELEELKTLSSRWVYSYNGISGLSGRIFTGTNGNTLFIPAAGRREGSSIQEVDSRCRLWSSSLYLDSPECAYACCLDSGNIGFNINMPERWWGCSVRAVC